MAEADDICLDIPENKKFNYRIAMLIFCKDKVVMHNDGNYNWHYTPGGRVKFQEDSHSALLREMQEETGISEDLDFKFAGVVENFFTMDERNYHELMFVYKTEVEEEIEMPLCDHKGKAMNPKWMTLEDLKEVTVVPSFFTTRIFEFRDKDFIHIIHDDTK